MSSFVRLVSFAFAAAVLSACAASPPPVRVRAADLRALEGLEGAAEVGEVLLPQRSQPLQQIATARALMAGGARVCAWDENEAARKAAEAAGVPLVDLGRRDWQNFAALVLSPGIPLKFPEPHRFVRMAQMVGVPVIGDMELFARAVNELKDFERPRIVGITGTNGKSTTTALVGHILKSCGKDVRVGGNIGVGVLDLEKLHGAAIYVLELSSYQLDLAESLKCDVAVMLNISPDHLARHGGMDGYVNAKRRIFRNQGPEDYAIIGVDDTIDEDAEKLVLRVNQAKAALLGVAHRPHRDRHPARRLAFRAHLQVHAARLGFERNAHHRGPPARAPGDQHRHAVQAGLGRDQCGSEFDQGDPARHRALARQFQRRDRQGNAGRRSGQNAGKANAGKAYTPPARRERAHHRIPGFGGPCRRGATPAA